MMHGLHITSSVKLHGEVTPKYFWNKIYNKIKQTGTMLNDSFLCWHYSERLMKSGQFKRETSVMMSTHVTIWLKVDCQWRIR